VFWLEVKEQAHFVLQVDYLSKDFLHLYLATPEGDLEVVLHPGLVHDHVSQQQGSEQEQKQEQEQGGQQQQEVLHLLLCHDHNHNLSWALGEAKLQLHDVAGLQV
ncbi:hypothetical protein H0H81_006431, partial [Sphagnurus paluster]